MNLSKQSNFHIDTFVKLLKKKEQQIDQYSNEVKTFFDQMVAIKDYLGTVYNDDKIPLNERTKIFMTKLKELENIGESHDNTVKKIKELRSKINLELEILVKNVNLIDNHSTYEQIRNHILQYIESKR